MLHLIADVAQVGQRRAVHFQPKIPEPLADCREIYGGLAIRDIIDPASSVGDRLVSRTNNRVGVRQRHAPHEDFLGKQQNAGIEIAHRGQRSLGPIERIVLDAHPNGSDSILEHGTHDAGAASSRRGAPEKRGLGNSPCSIATANI